MFHEPRRVGNRAASHAAAIVLALLGLLLTACASTTLPGAAKLGADGKAAATAMQQAALASPDDIQRLKLSDAFMASYVGPTAATGMTQRSELIAKIQQELTLRAAVLGSLANTYGALAALASYDASGSFNTALSSLNTAVTAYAKAANLSPPPSVAAQVPSGGGFLASMVQTEMVRSASHQMVPQLNQAIAAMQSYEPVFTGFKEIAESQGGDAATVLYSSGLFSMSPLLNQLGTQYGYTASPDADRLLGQPRNRALRQELAQAQASQTVDQLKLVSTAYDQSLAALQKLPAQHAALENGTPLDLSQLEADLTALQQTVARLATVLPTK
jgi:hypothetical protein